MIIVDFSQIMIMSISAASGQFKGNLTEDMIRHIFLNNIAGYRKKYSAEFGDELIMACDGKGYWRKDFFPYYKMKRAKNRAESPLDWDFVFQCINKIYDEIQEYFSYKIVKVDGCEGDDVIAVLVDYFNKTRAKNAMEDSDSLDSLFGPTESEPEPILIISADKDFLQLQNYPNVKQFSPLKKRFISEQNPNYSRYEKILKGDAGDGVMNIFSDDDVFAIDGKRQIPATAKKLEPLLESLLNTNTLPDNTDDIIRRNFERNKKLIDLYDLQISKELYNKIIDVYEDANVAPKSKIYDYLLKYQMRNLLSQIDKF